jgi:hypothetical protein
MRTPISSTGLSTWLPVCTFRRKTSSTLRNFPLTNRRLEVWEAPESSSAEGPRSNPSGRRRVPLRQAPTISISIYDSGASLRLPAAAPWSAPRRFRRQVAAMHARICRRFRIPMSGLATLFRKHSVVVPANVRSTLAGARLPASPPASATRRPKPTVRKPASSPTAELARPARPNAVLAKHVQPIAGRVRPAQPTAEHVIRIAELARRTHARRNVVRRRAAHARMSSRVALDVTARHPSELQ